MQELEPGEKLVWSGGPRQGLLFRATDAILVPFTLVACGLAILWEVEILTEDWPLPFVFIGAPFVLLTLYGVFGRFVVDARLRARTAYGLTDRRAIILSGLLDLTVESIPLRALGDVTVEERPDGSGTITFGSASPGARLARGLAMPAMRHFAPPAFEMISSVASVDRILGEARRACTVQRET